MERVLVLLITLALLVGMVGCPADSGPDPSPPVRYNLTITSTAGGSVTMPGEGTFTYEAGTVVDLAAETEEGYRFDGWTGDVGTVGNMNSVVTTITMNGNYGIMVNFVALYVLTIDSTQGGQVIMPGEGAFAYATGTVVPLVAEAEDGYRFVKWMGDVSTVVYNTSAFATIAMNDDYSVTVEFEVLDPQKLFAGGSGTEGNPYRIADWYHLNNVRYFLGAHYRLVNNLDSTTPGYAELASTTANHGKGWQPIGTPFVDPVIFEIIAPVSPFAGRFDGNGYEIKDLFINRPDENVVGLFADVDEGGFIENLRVTNGDVTGCDVVGGLVGYNAGGVHSCNSQGRVTGLRAVGGLVGSNAGTVTGSSSAGSVDAGGHVGGLVGYNGQGIVRASYASSTVTGDGSVGGLIGANRGGWVSDCYASGIVMGEWSVGGVVGAHDGWSISESYFTGVVTGSGRLGGVVGSKGHASTVINSYYNYDEVLINGQKIITIGALFGGDFAEWLDNDGYLDINERLSLEDGYYVIDTVSDFKQLLAFGQDDSLRFRLGHDLDLAAEPNFYIPYLAGEFDGSGHRIWNLSLDLGIVSQVGLFGYVGRGGEVTQLGAENVNVAGGDDVGALAGWNDGIVASSHATGSVAGGYGVGGLVGYNCWAVTNSLFSGSVTGAQAVGGLVGWPGIVSNSYYNYDEVLINGRNTITIGALFAEDFDQWLANDRFLDVSKRLSKEGDHYLIDDVSDFKQLLIFGQDDSLRFRLRNDIDLAAEPDLYIPYLAGDFDGDGHVIRNLSVGSNHAAGVGLFGCLAGDARVSATGVENVSIAGGYGVGGLVGWNGGAVSDCYSTGRVTGYTDVGGLVGFDGGTVRHSYSNCDVAGHSAIGGLVGRNWGETISESYSTGSVTGERQVGGLVGWNDATVSNCYSTGRVTGERQVGGLVGLNSMTVSNSFSTGRVTGQSSVGGLVGCREGVVWGSGITGQCFWDLQTSGQDTSEGGAGKTTAEMMDITTFTAWDIIAVADPGTRNATCTWNVVDGQTYPFLSWEPVA